MRLIKTRGQLVRSVVVSIGGAMVSFGAGSYLYLQMGVSTYWRFLFLLLFISLFTSSLSLFGRTLGDWRYRKCILSHRIPNVGAEDWSMYEDGVEKEEMDSTEDTEDVDL